MTLRIPPLQALRALEAVAAHVRTDHPGARSFRTYVQSFGPHAARTYFAVFEFESGEQSFLLKPTALSLVFSADAQASNSASIAIAPNRPSSSVRNRGCAIEAPTA